MIKKTLYFGNPAYLSLRDAQLVIKLPEVVKNDTLPERFKQKVEVTKPIEDIGISVWESGIDPDTFVEYRELRSKCKGVDSDGDGTADRNTVKNDVLVKRLHSSLP